MPFYAQVMTPKVPCWQHRPESHDEQPQQRLDFSLTVSAIAIGSSASDPDIPSSRVVHARKVRSMAL